MAKDARHEERRSLCRAIEADARRAASHTGRPVLDSRVMEAIERVPRHEFVPAESGHVAYANVALPIGHGQTISQPFIVALMTDVAAPTRDSVVLEIGTGCGYQTAVLAELAGRVFSVERVPELAAAGAERLEKLGYANIRVRTGDGYEGWPEHAPFDAIVVTAGAPEVPPPLVDQLAPGGRLVIPVGELEGRQELTLLVRDPEGPVTRREVLPVAFVPLLRGEER